MEEAIILSQGNAYIYSLIILWACLLLLNIIVTAIFKTKNTNWGRFWAVWFFTALLSGVILAGLIISPSFVTDSINYLLNFFK